VSLSATAGTGLTASCWDRRNGQMSRPALVAQEERRDPVPVASVLHALFLAGALVPLIAMLSALLAAVWIREGEREAPARRSQR
jgi:hypothetical protein